MTHPFSVLVGVLAMVVFGTGVGAAVVRSGDDEPATEVTAGPTTTVAQEAPTTSAPTTSAPTTTPSRPTTTRLPRVTTTIAARPAATVAPVTVAPTTTRPALTRAAATQALCKEIEASVRLVTSGNEVGGGLRLLRAVNTYGDAADPTVVAQARRMLAAGLNGDYEAGAAATSEAASACSRLGYPIVVQVQCVTFPCP